VSHLQKFFLDPLIKYIFFYPPLYRHAHPQRDKTTRGGGGLLVAVSQSARWRCPSPTCQESWASPAAFIIISSVYSWNICMGWRYI